MTISAIHCSDLHLDKNFNYSNYKKGLKRKEDVNNNFKRIVDYAIEKKTILFLISGDIYDKVTPTNFTQKFFIEQLKRLHDAKIQVVMIGGNHDVPKTSFSTPLAIDIPASAGLATVFSQTDKIEHKIIEIGKKKVCISGISFDPLHEREDPLKDKEIPLLGDINILLLHASFNGMDVMSSIPSFAHQNPISPSDISKLNLDYLGLGHFHNYFERAIGSIKIGNPGTIEKISFQEESDKKGFLWLEFGEKLTTSFIELNTRPMETYTISVSKEIPDLLDFIKKKLKPKSDPEKILHLIIEGEISQEQYKAFKIRDLIKYCIGHFFYVKPETNWEVEGYGKLFIGKVDRPVEAFQKRIEKIMLKSPKDKKFLEEVLSEGVKYLEAEE